MMDRKAWEKDLEHIKDPEQRKRSEEAADIMFPKKLSPSLFKSREEYYKSGLHMTLIVILSLAVVGIVLYLFTQSVFQGFVALVLGLLFLRLIFSKKVL